MCSLRSRVSDWIKWSFGARNVSSFSSHQKKEEETHKKIIMGKKKLSGAAKRKKKKEREEAIEEAKADLERLKLGPTKLWTGLVTHHRDIFISHVLPKLNRTDRSLFAAANIESFYLLKYAGANVSRMDCAVYECTSISTMEMMWNNMKWGEKDDRGTVIDQAWFCAEVVRTNKLELLKWVREVKKCEWNKWTINDAASVGNLEMLKYCFANGCPYDEQESSRNAAEEGHLDCLRFLFDKMKPSPETEKKAAGMAVENGHIDILKYFVEERKITNSEKHGCAGISVACGNLTCLKYLVEEVKVPLDHWLYIASVRYKQHTECLHYLREKGCPEPTDEEYAAYAEGVKEIESRRR